jgi:hypothetical protein
MIGPPIGSIGRLTLFEPVASTRCSHWMRVADLDGLAVDDFGPAVDDLDLVLFQQRGDAGGQAIDDAVLPLDALADVEGRRRNADAQCRMLVVVLRLVKLLGHMDQRLGRNAADVQAGAAQRLAFDQHVEMPSCRRGSPPHSRRGRRR